MQMHPWETKGKWETLWGRVHVLPLLENGHQGSHVPVNCLAQRREGPNKCMLLFIKVLCQLACKVTLNRGSVGHYQTVAFSPSRRGWGVC